MPIHATHADGSPCKAKDPGTCRFRGGVVNVTITRNSSPSDIARALDFVYSEAPSASVAEKVSNPTPAVPSFPKSATKIPFWLGETVVFKETGVTGKVAGLRGDGGYILDSASREYVNFKWRELEGTEEHVAFLDAMAAQGRIPK